MKSILATLCLATFVIAAAPEVRAKPATDNKAETKAPPRVFTSPQKEGAKATCPVTGEEFTIAKDTVHREYKGKHVYFCCASCQKAFDKDPDKYVK